MRRRAFAKRIAAGTTALGLAGSATARRRRHGRRTKDDVTIRRFNYTGPAGPDAESDVSVTVDGSTVIVEGTVAPGGRELDGATPSASLSDGTVQFALSYESR